SMRDQLLYRIESRQSVVAVVGLGYVGLPVLVSFAEAGFATIGVDISADKIETLQQGRSYLRDVPDERIAPLVESGQLRGSLGFDDLAGADAVLICVPTPITQGTPDLSLVVSAAKEVARRVSDGTLVVIESTTYPGSTEELIQPLLEATGRTVGEEIFLAFSPERIDPGNSTYEFADIPKVVGGVGAASTTVAAALYGQVVPKVIEVSGPKEAEFAKLLENTYRHVNIALVNELAIYANEMGIDIWEAIEAAATKPFGFMPFWPGPGWGGHCIPLDPSYLSWRVRRDRAHEVRFVEVAQTVNAEMPRYVAERVSLLLNDQGRSVRGAKILGIGVAYKPGTADMREAGAIKVLNRLAKQGANVSLHDPLVPSIEIAGRTYDSVALTAELLASQDLVVIFVPQVQVDWDLVASSSTAVLDCCNALGVRTQNIHRL
ncbi:MAG: nucleotide sugar dehydrogenase, partial [Actinomycetota bacterium]|nr:nucleotide sugar dehydrogenase [Actinomycetota bacterium]